MFIGLVLLVVGLVALAVRLGWVQGGIWGWVWPLLLILLGLAWFLRGVLPGRRRHWGGPWCCWGHGPGEEEDRR